MYRIKKFSAVVEIPCSEKSAKSETSNFGLRFLRFFEMTLQKNVKSRVFLDFQKNVENVFTNYASNYQAFISQIPSQTCPHRGNGEGQHG